jgi:hypothetical protein
MKNSTPSGDIEVEIIAALKARDEPALREKIKLLMDNFLKGEVDKYEVDKIASDYLNAEFFWEKECNGFEINDETLRDVYESLAALDSYPDEEAMNKVKKLRESLH